MIAISEPLMAAFNARVDLRQIEGVQNLRLDVIRVSANPAWVPFGRGPVGVDVGTYGATVVPFSSGCYLGQTHNDAGFVMFLAVRRDGGHLTLRKYARPQSV